MRGSWEPLRGTLRAWLHPRAGAVQWDLPGAVSQGHSLGPLFCGQWVVATHLQVSVKNWSYTWGWGGGGVWEAWDRGYEEAGLVRVT